MKASGFVVTILLATIGLVLNGCISRDIIIKPSLPSEMSSTDVETPRTVSLTVYDTRYGNKSGKTLIGESESLGVHISDIWLEEPPPVFVKRLLENIITPWGYRVSSGKELNQLSGHINRFFIESKAINVLQFQFSGVIDVDLSVHQENGTELYNGNFVGTCKRVTATEVAGKDNLEKLFNLCIEEFQKQLESDIKLRYSLSSK